MNQHEHRMSICLKLAKRSSGYTAPNPMVGCVIVHNNEIIAEGWHRGYGLPHAEVEAISKINDAGVLRNSTLYVNLEPCAHWGKTPPCADLIVEKQIPRLVIGSRDPHSIVNGKGTEKLKNAGIEVISGILENECNDLNRRFFTFHRKRRPYIILKWAETADGFIAPEDGQRRQISGHAARILLHKWRGEEQAILTGSRTAIIDKPRLDTRYYPGKNPLKLVIDPAVKADVMPGSVVFGNRNELTEKQEIVLLPDNNSIAFILDELYRRNIISVMIEGGADTLQRFIDHGIFDEIRIIKSKQVQFKSGRKAPQIKLTNPEITELPEDLIYTERMNK